MFGFLLGTACLVGLFWVLKGPRRFRRHACDEPHRHDGRGGGFGARALLRWLFERLDTTPGQERVIRASVEDLVDRAYVAKRDFEASRQDVARAIRADSFDAEAMGEAFAKHDVVIGELRKALVESLARTHDALDDRQRKRLAELVEAGLGRRWYGPYRSPV